MLISTLRVLIVDGSPVYRKMFAKTVEAISSDARVEYSSDFDGAYAKIQTRDYDIIILDVDAIANGTAEALDAIAKTSRGSSTVVVARPSARGEEALAEAMAHGAAGSMTKPIYDSYGDNAEVAMNLLSDIAKRLAAEKGASSPGERPAAPCCAPPEVRALIGRAVLSDSGTPPDLVLIASSTGGPQALEKIIAGVDSSFPSPILIVQHMLPRFSGMLALDLDTRTSLRVKEAESGEIVAAGTVYVAPGGFHMRLDSEMRVKLDEGPMINGVRPAADALFKSIATSSPNAKVFVAILTGMGRDSEIGLAALKRNRHCFCVTQSERTCVVYGMPRAAVESGLSDATLDLNDIADRMNRFRFPFAQRRGGQKPGASGGAT